MNRVIEVAGLKRSYISRTGLFQRERKRVEALKGIDLSVERGEIFGILGPNGAGKTTLIKILTTLLAPDNGTARVLGSDCFGGEKTIRKRINFLFGGERSLYWRLSARDNLKYFSDLYLIPRKVQRERIDSLLEKTGLSDSAEARVETFSKGMKQRLQIARSLLNEPEILFLDEPTIGLDPHGARDLRDMVREISAGGTTVILTTHYMAEAEELCDRIAIMNKGKIVALDDISGLRSLIRHPGKIRIPLDLWEGGMERYFTPRSHSAFEVRQPNPSCREIHTEDPERLLDSMMRQNASLSMRGVQTLDVTLEDVYLELIGDSLT